MENSRSLSKSQWNSNVGVSKLRGAITKLLFRDGWTNDTSKAYKNSAITSFLTLSQQTF